MIFSDLIIFFLRISKSYKNPAQRIIRKRTAHNTAVPVVINKKEVKHGTGS